MVFPAHLLALVALPRETRSARWQTRSRYRMPADASTERSPRSQLLVRKTPALGRQEPGCGTDTVALVGLDYRAELSAGILPPRDDIGLGRCWQFPPEAKQRQLGTPQQ